MAGALWFISIPTAIVRFKVKRPFKLIDETLHSSDCDDIKLCNRLSIDGKFLHEGDCYHITLHDILDFKTLNIIYDNFEIWKNTIVECNIDEVLDEYKSLRR